MVTIKIKTDNAAFDGVDGGPEVARILRKIATAIEDSYLVSGAGTIRDSNGNTCGSVVVTGNKTLVYKR